VTFKPPPRSGRNQLCALQFLVQEALTRIDPRELQGKRDERQDTTSGLTDRSWMNVTEAAEGFNLTLLDHCSELQIVFISRMRISTTGAETIVDSTSALERKRERERVSE